MRSVTLVSIMFIMPMPPTRSEMLAVAVTSTWKDISVAFICSMMDESVITVTRSSACAEGMLNQSSNQDFVSSASAFMSTFS